MEYVLLFLSYPCYLGGWGLIDGNSTWSINGTSFLEEKLAGSPAFFSLGVDIDDKDSNNYILSVRYMYTTVNTFTNPCLVLCSPQLNWKPVKLE